MKKFQVQDFYKSLYKPKPEFQIIDVPRLKFLSIDGMGDPNSSLEYQNSVLALYSVSYALKFHSKNHYQKDYTVGPLEGLWWADDMDDYLRRDKSKWKWRMMVWQPDWISQDDFNSILPQVKKKKPNEKLSDLKLEDFEEGKCVQILHIGSYNDESPTIAKMHKEFIPKNGLIENGHHHEIYISDPRKTAPEKLKTILRQPVKQS